MNEPRLQEWRELANKQLSYFGIESKAADAINGLLAMVEQLQQQLDAVPVDAIRKVRANLSTDGNYSIRRTDGENMFIGETIMLGNLFEKIDNWLDTDKVPA